MIHIEDIQSIISLVLLAPDEDKVTIDSAHKKIKILSEALQLLEEERTRQKLEPMRDKLAAVFEERLQKKIDVFMLNPNQISEQDYIQLANEYTIYQSIYNEPSKLYTAAKEIRYNSSDENTLDIDNNINIICRRSLDESNKAAISATKE